MLKSKTRWKIETADKELAESIAAETGLSVLAARLLVQRGFTDTEEAKRFINMDESILHDPFLFKGMKEGTERIKRAIENGERILVFGDYDADGVTSTSVMFQTLQKLGAQAGYYVPNRFTEGYGPNENAFRQAKEEGVGVIVTVDTGISAVHEAEVAKELGIDLVITDHHEPPPQIPDAYAVINHKQEDCPYPFKDLAGVGVAFKTAQALLERFPEEFLDLFTLGTVADLVPLTGENRYLVKKGLQAIAGTSRPGLRALMDLAGVDGDEVTEEHVGFALGPRLNAAGRLDSAQPAVALLLTEDPAEGDDIARQVDDLNKERQKIVNDMTKEAVAQVEKDGPGPVIIVGQEGWNAGVIGIVASRLVEKYYRPTIVLSLDSETGLAKGSARSIEGFDMFRNLSECREWLPHFGGHPMAAGLTMEMTNIDQLRVKLGQLAEAVLTEDDYVPTRRIDLTAEVSEITVQAINDLKRLAPFGVGHPSPKVLIPETGIGQYKKIGSNKDHLKLTFEQDGAKLDGIGFRVGDLYEQLTPLDRVAVIGDVSINEWNGHVKPQLIIDDLKVEDWQLFDYRGKYVNWTSILEQNENEKLVYVKFRPETAVPAVLENAETEVVDVTSDRDNILLPEGASVILGDIPPSAEAMETLFHGSLPGRIYAVFTQDDDTFFQTLPTREHFKWYYAFLAKRKTFNLEKQARDLAKYKGWTKDTVDFMSQVFFELNFVTINNGFVTLQDQPSRKSLEESALYQSRVRQSELENQLVYSSYRALKQWFSPLFDREPAGSVQ
ncbi:single-stranded-DNA-specific exonuclease RecJ [Alteribacter natronophilus]|uniref:single-stranded-DNA-specific exonuclease RecJ n=1 Tax=Alteribacter natronophilus TaxID=2583810 RepID=UPI00110F61E2|nr:single-stranded-DNA-specific exonuclease RecJ [Alteribacter natronophilus]TMW73965.1 single-stranded-DNA-specific exonuclease RecJ [Alteribacter natronophilus]